MLNVGFISLGCAKNLVDTEVMLGILRENNVTIVQNPQIADIIITNTCGFIDKAKEESIQTILENAELKKHGNCKGIIVAGCLAQRYKEELLNEIPEIDVLIGTSSWNMILKAISFIKEGKRACIINNENLIYNDTMPRVITIPSYSAYVKIADGCNNRCSYCIIPSIRGKFTSRPLESIVKEVNRLVNDGVIEINLIAQDTTSYGYDLYGDFMLENLLKELIKIEKLKWIRLLYCYPKYFSDKVINLIASEPKILKYIDLPLQHIHNDILKNMYRKDTTEDITQLLNKIRKKINNVAIRTSFIVGFPGETENHFNKLKQFIQEQKFDSLGVFTYSQEEGTPAANFNFQVPEEIKEKRYNELMSIQAKISEELNQNLEGKKIDILLEQKSSENENIYIGRSYREAPDVDGNIYIENCCNNNPGDIVKAKIVQGFAYDLIAEKIN